MNRAEESDAVRALRRKITRRRFMQLAGGGIGAALAARCAPPIPQATPVPPPPGKSLAPVLAADGVVQTCCLKTHRYGGHFTMSLKNTVGLVAKRVPGESYDYMTELHGSPHQRLMIAEANAAYTPDLIVLDIKLGEMEGLEVLQRIKDTHRDKPVILNSAYSHYKNEFTSWLADAYITKSGDLTELKDKISELLKPINAR